jgi:hypothetical protein
VRENDRLLRTAHYTGGPEENGAKNTGEKGLGREPTAQNTHCGRLRCRKRMLHKYLISIKKDTVFRVIRVIDDTRDRARFWLAYCHGLRPSEIGMIQVKENTRR